MPDTGQTVPCQIVRCSNLHNWHYLENHDNKLFVHFFNFSDPKNMISTFLSTGHLVPICINLKWQTKKKWADYY